MAGSLNHIVDSETGRFTMDSIDNLGDAHEALEECFQIIRYVTGGSEIDINRVLHDLGFPEIQHSMASVATRHHEDAT